MNWTLIAWSFFAIQTAACVAVVVWGCCIAAHRRKVGAR